jgi:hypothetical protein
MNKLLLLLLVSFITLGANGAETTPNEVKLQCNTQTAYTSNGQTLESFKSTLSLSILDTQIRVIIGQSQPGDIDIQLISQKLGDAIAFAKDDSNENRWSLTNKVLFKAPKGDYESTTTVDIDRITGDLTVRRTNIDVKRPSDPFGFLIYGQCEKVDTTKKKF